MDVTSRVGDTVAPGGRTAPVVGAQAGPADPAGRRRSHTG